MFVLLRFLLIYALAIAMGYLKLIVVVTFYITLFTKDTDNNFSTDFILLLFPIKLITIVYYDGIIRLSMFLSTCELLNDDKQGPDIIQENICLTTRVATLVNDKRYQAVPGKR